MGTENVPKLEVVWLEVPNPLTTWDRLTESEMSGSPFGLAARIRFELPAPMPVSLTIYDVAGRVVRELRSAGLLPSGVSEMAWDGRDDRGGALHAGVYFCRMRAGPATTDRHLVLQMTKLE